MRGQATIGYVSTNGVNPADSSRSGPSRTVQSSFSVKIPAGFDRHIAWFLYTPSSTSGSVALFLHGVNGTVTHLPLEGALNRGHESLDCHLEP